MCAAQKSSLEEYNCNVWGTRKGNDYIDARDEKRTVSFSHPKGECCICFDESGLKMTCGHFICPDDLLDNTWEQIKNLKFEISCAKCPHIISTDDIIKFGIPNDKEEQLLTVAISVNFCESQDIQLCPGCESFCTRKDSNNPAVKCLSCTNKKMKDYHFCWYCLKEWNNPSNFRECGNSGCLKDDIDQLRASPLMEFNDGTKVVKVPQIRACPECFTVIQHHGGCNEMTCRSCKTKFCFICLTKTSGGSLICKGRNYTKITCTPAPIQTKLKK